MCADDPAPFEAELKQREKSLGLRHPDVAESCSNLAILYNQKGDTGGRAVLVSLCCVRCWGVTHTHIHVVGVLHTHPGCWGVSHASTLLGFYTHTSRLLGCFTHIHVVGVSHASTAQES